MEVQPHAVKEHRVSPPKRIPSLESPKDFLPRVTVNILPSQHISYPKNLKIKYLPYTFGEVKKVSQQGHNISKKESIDIVMSGIECGEFDPLDLTIPDVMYIGLLRKISSVGDTQVTISYLCDGCHTPQTQSLRTQELEFDDLLIEELPISADISGVEMQFRPLTVGQFFKLIESGNDEDDFWLLAAQCTNMEIEVAHSLISNSVREDVGVLQEIDTILYHGLSKVKVKCTDNKCAHETDLALDGGEGIIMPFRTDNRSIKKRIRFGKRVEL